MVELTGVSLIFLCSAFRGKSSLMVSAQYRVSFFGGVKEQTHKQTNAYTTQTHTYTHNDGHTFDLED